MLDIEMLGLHWLDKNNEPVLCRSESDLEEAQKAKARTHIVTHICKSGKLTDCYVSTVFLKVEHYGGMWWETMVFGGPLDEYCRRYASFPEAVRGHWEVVAEAQEKVCTD